MKRVKVFVLLALSLSLSAQARDSLREVLCFQLGSYELSAVHRARLDDAIAKAKPPAPLSELLILGYERRGQAFNEALLFKRASAVEAYFAAAGLAPPRKMAGFVLEGADDKTCAESEETLNVDLRFEELARDSGRLRN